MKARAFFKEHAVFLGILGLCGLLRFIPFFSYQFTLDELSGLGRTVFHNFNDLVEKGVKTSDTHPALVQIFIFCLAKLFGYANWVIKLPFLLMSFGIIIYAYRFCLRHFSKQAGVFAAVIFSFSLVFVYYAPIARMYISGVFFSMAMLYYFFEIFFRQQHRPANFIWLGLFALLSALNQHINALFAFTLCASGLFFLEKETRKSYLLMCLAVVLCYLPHLPVTLYQLQVGGIGFDQGGWLPPVSRDALLIFLKVLLGTGKTYVVFVLLVLLAFILKRQLRISKPQFFLLLLFLVNYSIIYFYSVYRAPVFQNSVMLFSGVAFILFLSSLMEYKNKFVFMAAVLVLSATLLYKTYWKKDYLHQAVTTVFEYQFQRTAYYKQLYGDKQVYPIFFDGDVFMREIYFKKYGVQFDCSLASDSLGITRKLTRLIPALTSDYLVLASAMPAQEAIARVYFPYLIENTQTQGINYKVYSKKEADQQRQVKGDEELKYSDLFEPGIFKYTNFTKPAGKPFAIKPWYSGNKFPFVATADYWALNPGEGQMILTKTKLKLYRPGSPSRLSSCISVKSNVTEETYNYAGKTVDDFITEGDSTVTFYVNNFIGTTHRNVKGPALLNVYIWNPEKERFTLNDIEIRLIDYWPQKWHFWD